MIYLVAGLKFGANKSRTAVSLTMSMSLDTSKKVALFDTDPTGFSSEYLEWHKHNYGVENLSVFKVAEEDLEVKLESALEKYDEVIVDVGLGEALRDSLKHSQRLLVPLNTNKQSLWIMWVMSHLERSLNMALDRPDDFKAYSFFVNDAENDETSEALKRSVRQSKSIEFLDEFELQNLMIHSSDAEFKRSVGQIRAMEEEVV